MSSLEFSITLGIVVFIIRRTDAIYWYGQVFGLVDTAYLRHRRDGKNYLEWLNEKHDTFWTELVTCPFCMATWLSFLVVGFYDIECGPWAWLTIVGTYALLAFLKAALGRWT